MAARSKQQTGLAGTHLKHACDNPICCDGLSDRGSTLDYDHFAGHPHLEEAMTNRRARSLLAVLMAFAVLVAACGSDSDESRTTTPEPASGTEAQPTTRDDTTEAQEAEPAAAPTDDDAPGAAQTAAGPSAGGDTTETQEPEPAAALTDDDTPGAAQTAAPPDDPDVQPSLGDIAFTLTPITADDTTSRTEEPPEQDSQDVNLSALLDFICSHEIFVMDANGSNLRQATHNTTSISRPVWSPDGTRFLYVDRHWVHARIQLECRLPRGGRWSRTIDRGRMRIRWSVTQRTRTIHG